jgi:phosphopantetheine--protein transferase-like protein
MIELMENIAVGTDIENISRFENKSLENDNAFLNKIFTENEINYSFSKSKPSQHLAARYCAKEAIIKALNSLSNLKLLYNEVEILNKPDGSPFVNLINYNDKFCTQISLSHCSDRAIAFAVVSNIRSENVKS